MRCDKYVFLIGAMKSGTTSLYDWLAQHPEVCGSIVKETQFFAPRQDSRLHIDGFEELWNFNPSKHKICLDGSTGYTKWPSESGVPQRIKEAGLNPRFIYVVRDPAERVASHWNHLRKRREFDLSTDPLSSRFVDISRYHAQLAQYRSVFPDPDRYLVLPFSEISNPIAIAQRCFEFMGIDPHFEPTANVRNEMRQMSAIELWCRRSALFPFAHWIPYTLRHRVRDVLRRKSSRAIVMVLNDNQKRRLHAILMQDMAQLSKDYGIDTEGWCR